MKTVILAGGRGSRLAEETTVRPKPMVEIGERPILWHIMRLYGAHGFKDFVVALGYKGEVIKEYFLHFHALNSDLTVDLATGDATIHDGGGADAGGAGRDGRAGGAPGVSDWTIDLVDTGLETQTGGRVRRLRDRLGDETFMLTYGDGLSDVDVRAVVDFHRSHGGLATVTAVRPPARFGTLRFEGDRVAEFLEKPQTGSGWINGGFFVLEPGVIDYIESDQTVWERGPLEALARDGELHAFRHDGFFQPMDTIREKLLLERLWESGDAPWTASW